VVELVDALRSGRSGRKPVRVRVPPSACLEDGKEEKVGRDEQGGELRSLVNQRTLSLAASVLLDLSLFPALQLTHPKCWPILTLGYP
jgi:hypothetical protein